MVISIVDLHPVISYDCIRLAVAMLLASLQANASPMDDAQQDDLMFEIGECRVVHNRPPSG